MRPFPNEDPITASRWWRDVRALALHDEVVDGPLVPRMPRAGPAPQLALFEVNRRFVTVGGARLHRVARVDLDGRLRSRCGLTAPGAYLLDLADGLLGRLDDCERCRRSLGSVP
jgi:hypothetical protein